MVLCATSRDFAGHWVNRFQFAALGLLVSCLRVAPHRVAQQLAGELSTEGLSRAEREWVLSELRRHDVRSLLEAAEALGRFSSRDWIGTVDVPVSVVVTANDKLVPTRRQVKLARAIPSAVIHVMDGTHMCCGTEPDTFAETLVEACQLVARRAQRLPNGLDSTGRGRARPAHRPRRSHRELETEQRHGRVLLPPDVSADSFTSEASSTGRLSQVASSRRPVGSTSEKVRLPRP
jgi:hypothetical protein